MELWWGARNGGWPTSPPCRGRPAAEWIRVTSSACSVVRAGSSPSRRRASIVLPEPGGPTSSRWWRAGGRHLERLAGHRLAPDLGQVEPRRLPRGQRRLLRVGPRFDLLEGQRRARRGWPPAGPCGAPPSGPRPPRPPGPRPRRRAMASTSGTMPATARTLPSRPSSPTKPTSATASGGISPCATSTPTAVAGQAHHRQPRAHLGAQGGQRARPRHGRRRAGGTGGDPARCGGGGRLRG